MRLGLEKHKIIIGSIFILVGFYGLYGMLGYFFAIAPAWQKLIYIILLGLYLVAGYSQIKEKPWAVWPSLPTALGLVIVFPIGTAIGAYYFWILFKLEAGVYKPISKLSKKLSSLNFIDYQILAFLSVLIPYAAFGANSIGGMNIIAAALAALITVIAAISKFAVKSKIGWVYSFMFAITISLFFIRDYDAGYGP